MDNNPAGREFQALLQRAQARDSEAVQRLYQKFSGPVQVVVRRHLEMSLRSAYDSQDFLQSVWAAFFCLGNSARYQFEKPEDLIRFLSRTAMNKVIDAARKRAAAKRN